MSRKLPTRIGDGAPAVMIEETRRLFPSLEVIHRGDDIRRPTDWLIQEPRHTIVVHLGGQMDHLETEMESFGGSTGTALPGEIWTIPAGRTYHSHARGKDIEYAVLRCATDAHTLLGKPGPKRFDLSPMAGVRDDFLHHTTRQLVQAMQAADDVSGMLAESLSQTVSLYLLQSLSPESRHAKLGFRQTRPTGPELTPLLSRMLREHIESRLEERLLLEELAALVAMTTHQFLVAFRKAFGSTPMHYIIRQRVRQAQRLLLNSRKDISTIALECGFSSHSHLTASFTKWVGCSPKIFRETARQFQIPTWRKK